MRGGNDKREIIFKTETNICGYEKFGFEATHKTEFGESEVQRAFLLIAVKSPERSESATCRPNEVRESFSCPLTFINFNERRDYRLYWI